MSAIARISGPWLNAEHDDHEIAVVGSEAVPDRATKRWKRLRRMPGARLRQDPGVFNVMIIENGAIAVPP